MNEIERLISRHLDGELTPSEETRLRKLLVESQDARALLREMTVLARAARRTPGLHAPGAEMEARLFHRLHQEGLYHQTPPAMRDPAMLRSPARETSVMAMVRRGALVAAMVVAVVGGGYLLDEHQAPQAPVHAEAVAPVAAPLLADRDIRSERGIRGEIPAVSIPENGGDIAVRSSRSSRASSAGYALRRSLSARVSPPLASAENALALASRIAEASAPDTLSASYQFSVRERSLAYQISSPKSDTAVSAPSQPAALAAIPEFPVPPDDLHLPPSFQSDERGTRWSAAVRGGIAALGTSGESAREMSVGVGMELKGGHRMALLVGSGPTLTETRYRNTGIAISAPTPSQVPTSNRITTQRQGVQEYEKITRSETWLGVGYSYSVPLVAGLTLDPGLSAGIGSTSWRVGVELPVRYRLGGRVSMECALSANRTVARDQTADELGQVNVRNNYIYTSTIGQATFNSFGVQLGVRVDLTGE